MLTERLESGQHLGSVLNPIIFHYSYISHNKKMASKVLIKRSTTSTLAIIRRNNIHFQIILIIQNRRNRYSLGGRRKHVPDVPWMLAKIRNFPKVSILSWLLLKCTVIVQRSYLWWIKPVFSFLLKIWLLTHLRNSGELFRMSS